MNREVVDLGGEGFEALDGEAGGRVARALEGGEAEVAHAADSTAAFLPVDQARVDDLGEVAIALGAVGSRRCELARVDFPWEPDGGGLSHPVSTAPI